LLKPIRRLRGARQVGEILDHAPAVRRAQRQELFVGRARRNAGYPAKALSQRIDDTRANGGPALSDQKERRTGRKAVE
jgi:hypothetical protein